MVLGYFWSLPRGVSPRLEWGHARALSSRAVAAVSHFPLLDQGICGFSSRLSHEAFPRGFHTRLSQVPPWCESICRACDVYGTLFSFPSRGARKYFLKSSNMMVAFCYSFGCSFPPTGNINFPYIKCQNSNN